MGAKKNFVIDTNVILHDYNCLKNFQENDIYLPSPSPREAPLLKRLSSVTKSSSRRISKRTIFIFPS